MLIMHGAIWADFLRPLATQPTLAGFRRIRYHRRGYGDSSGPAGGFDANVADAVACSITSRWTAPTLLATPRAR